VIAAAGRMAFEDHTELANCFPDPRRSHRVRLSRSGDVISAQGLRL
jgi:hypothetical protein